MASFLRYCFKKLEKPCLPLLTVLGRLVVKLASYDTARLRLHVAGLRILGPQERVIVGRHVDLQNSFINTACGTVTFGDFSFCGQHCLFLTGTHDYRQKEWERRKHPTSGNDIVIGRDVWICSGATILGGVTIADHAVIAAGAVVTSNCEKAGVYAGVPARLIREIDFKEDPRP